MTWWGYMVALGMIAVPAISACLCAHWAGEARRARNYAEGAARRARVAAEETAIATPADLARRRAEVAEMVEELRGRTRGKP